MSSAQPKIFVGCGTLATGKGGISSVSRMMLRSFSEENIPVNTVSLLENSVCGTQLLFDANKNKFLFASKTYAAALSCKYMIFDHVGLARTSPKIIGLKRKYAVWMHGAEVLKNMTRSRMDVIRNASCILVNSDFTLRQFEKKYFPLPNAHVCPLGTEASCIPEPDTKYNGSPTVGILARITNDGFMKGHLHLVDAWSRVLSKIPDARLIIAGEGSGLERLKDYVAQSKASQNIELWGRLDDERLNEFWNQTDVFAMPSRVEGFGLVYAEAMQHSKPVIASVHDAGNEININRETGFNVNLNEKNALADAIAALLSNKKLREQMGHAAFARWREHYQFSHFKSRFIEIVRNNLLT